MTELWYRLNVFAEKQFFNKELADGLIVPANLISYYGIGMPELLADCKLPFLIDPTSYVWGINPPVLDSGGLRKSFKKLVEKLDCKAASMLGHQRIQTLDEKSPEFAEFVRKFLQLQLFNVPLSDGPRRQSIDRIKRFKEGSTSKEPTCLPYAIVPPYLYFENVVGNPYNKTLFAAQLAKDLDNQHKIFPCLCMSRSILADNDQIDIIFRDFQTFDGIILWINNFDETKASFDELVNLTKFIKKMSSRGIGNN